MSNRKLLLPVLLIIYIAVLGIYMKSSCMLVSWCGQDMDQYIDYSTSILTGHGYSAHEVSTLYFVHPEKTLYIPETMRLPAYPLLLSLSRLVYNHPPVLLVLNGIFITVILIYSYKLYTYFFKNSWWIPYLLLLINPTIIFYTTQMASVDLFTYAMITGFTYHAVLLYKHQKNIMHFIFTFIFGIGAIFSRQNTLLYILPVTFLPILENALQYLKMKKEIFTDKFFLLCLGFVLVLSIWIGRNFFLTSAATISTFSDLQLFNEYTYFSLFPNKESTNLVDWLYTQKAGEVFMTEQIAQNVPIPVAFNSFNKIIHKKTTEYILAHPGEVLMQFGIASKSFFLDTTFVWKDTQDILSHLKKIEAKITIMLLLGFLLFPFAYIWEKVKDRVKLYIWIGLFFYVFFSAFFHGTVVGNRGVLPLYSVFVLLSFLSLSIIFDKVVKKYVTNKRGETRVGEKK